MATTEITAEQNNPSRSPLFGTGTWCAILCTCEVPQGRTNSSCTQVAREPSNPTILFMRQGASAFPAHFNNMIQISKVISLQIVG